MPFRADCLSCPKREGIVIETTTPGKTAHLFWDVSAGKLKVTYDGTTHEVGG